MLRAMKSDEMQLELFFFLIIKTLSYYNKMWQTYGAEIKLLFLLPHHYAFYSLLRHNPKKNKQTSGLIK